MISVPDAAFLILAGVVAGLVGTAGGITSLVSYPALLLVGLPTLTANVANIVAIVTCWPGSALASRPELRGQARWLRRWTAVAAVGGGAGAVLLLLTSPGLFARVVPFLVALGSLALLLQPRLAAHHARRRSGGRLILPAGVLSLAVYNGYFGAGSGVMTLALLMVTVDGHLPRANALKNMVIGGGAVASSAALVVFGPVDWSAVVPLGVGLFAGSTLGPVVARRLPATLLRRLVAVLGFGLAIELALRGGL
jgi:uncharacterized protein